MGMAEIKMKLCEDCGLGISTKRLKAIPDTTRCVGCQSISDVYIKRFDDTAKDGEIQASSYFFSNMHFESAIRKFKGSVPYDNLGYTTPNGIKPIIYNGLASIFEEEKQ
jgi:hypothetical protein